jgi:hypothetical protein
MPDVYAASTEADPTVVEVLGDALELRATDPQHQQMLSDFLGRIELSQPAPFLPSGSSDDQPLSQRTVAYSGR